jgi:hypothetical protein
MSTNFLSEEDFTFQNNNDDLSEKYVEISQVTSSYLLDLSDADIGLIKECQSNFEQLKNQIFQNSDEILSNTKDSPRKEFLMEIQAQLLNNWKDYGFTEGFFHRYYQIVRHKENSDLTEVAKERIELLLKILKEQELLILTFGVLSNKNPPVFVDVEKYM